MNSLKISLNDVIITNESYVNRSYLVNYILNNSKNDYGDYRNLGINTSTKEEDLPDNQFISKKTYYPAPVQEVDEDTSDKYHYIDFKIPIF